MSTCSINCGGLADTCSRLLETTEHEEALRLLDEESKTFALVSAMDADGKRAADVVEAFLLYMRGQWMPIEMWQSWSKRGRVDAAARLGVSIDDVLTTSNHLENFNGRLKNSYIPQWQHSGRRLRFDSLIYHLVTDILPRIFARHRLAIQYSTWKTERFRVAAGGRDLRTRPPNPSTHSHSKSSHHSAPSGFLPRAWFEPDPSLRDPAARILLANGHINPIPAGCPFELWATCRSSVPVRSDQRDTTRPAELPPIHYSLTVHPTGAATCTCLDWRKRGGACKHLRAFRLLIDSWAKDGLLSCVFLFPLTEAEAMETEQRNHHWYGDSYHSAITLPAEDSREHPVLLGLLPGLATSGSLSCSLPPPHVDEQQSYVLSQAADLHALESDPDVTTNSPGGSDLAPPPLPIVSESRPKLACPTQTPAIAPDLPLLATITPPSAPTSTPAMRAVHFQVQSQVESDIAFLLPRLHGLQSVLEGTTHNLESTDDVIEFRSTLDTLCAMVDRHLALVDTSPPQDLLTPTSQPPTCTSYFLIRYAPPWTDSSQVSASNSTTTSPPSKQAQRLLPPSPEPVQKRKRSFKTS